MYGEMYLFAKIIVQQQIKLKLLIKLHKYSIFSSKKNRSYKMTGF